MIESNSIYRYELLHEWPWRIFLRMVQERAHNSLIDRKRRSLSDLALNKQQLWPKRILEVSRMAKKIAVIGVEANELPWVRNLVALLRHPDPGTPELARQALIYLLKAAAERPQSGR